MRPSSLQIPGCSVVLVRSARDDCWRLETLKKLPEHLHHLRRKGGIGRHLGSDNQQGRGVHQCRCLYIAKDNEVLTLGARDPHTVTLDTNLTVVAFGDAANAARPE